MRQSSLMAILSAFCLGAAFGWLVTPIFLGDFYSAFERFVMLAITVLAMMFSNLAMLEAKHDRGWDA